MWTKVAESYPRPLNGLLAAAATEAMRPHRDRRHISASDICRCGTLRVGEASHPGPAVFFPWKRYNWSALAPRPCSSDSGLISVPGWLPAFPAQRVLV